MKINKCGYTLIELLIYIGIFAIAAGMLSGILTTITRVQSREAASSEVTQQLSFVQSTIQRLVREASLVENTAGATSTILTLRMASSTLDKTIISADANAIYLKQGASATSTLTNERVKVSEFQVAKYENPGSHAVVQVNIALTYNSQRPYQQITRKLTTAIGRVTAATFDSNLLPNQDNSFSIGFYPSNRWQYIYLSDGTASAPSYTFGSNTGLGLFRAADNVLGLTTAGSERIRIDASGNVGIGTTGPGYKLDVSGTFRATATSTFSGNVGIGTTAPGAKLDISGGNIRVQGGYSVKASDQSGASDINMFNNNVDATAGFEITGSNRNIIFKNGGTEKLRIDSNGNVGIGTTGPSGPLHVKSGATDIIKTDTSGRVTMPNQPAFYAYATADQADSTTDETAQKVLLAGTTLDVGGCWSTANSRFTAPVGGIYFFHGEVRMDTLAASHYTWAKIYVNGAVRVSGDLENSADAVSYRQVGVTAVLQLNAGDYVELWETTYNTATTIASGSSYTYFEGFLIH